MSCPSRIANAPEFSPIACPPNRLGGSSFAGWEQPLQIETPMDSMTQEILRIWFI